ncbi:HU family DNA-binding protein [Fusobacterium nucleatum]|uniref:HU family DNA-binding protein n=1 Tax=Fusobacterium nucleatum TaxID=851 RepID=UPI003D03E1A5
MTKKEFAKLLFEKGVFTTRTEAEKKVDIIFDSIEKILLDGENLSIINWGKLEIVERAPRIGRNPKTGEVVKIGNRKSVKFRPGKAFLDKLN